MIDPKELRIGNWVFDDKTKVQLTAQSISMIVTGGLNYRKVSFDPIPLTPEWLKSRGAVKTNQTNQYAIERNGYYLVFHVVDGRWFLQNAGFRRPIDYVHEAQNLVFCLTGEEL